MWAKEDEGKIDLASIDTWKLHDILRYVHSYLANLRIVEQGLRFVNAEHRWFSSEIEHGQAYQDSPWYGTVCDAITAQEFQIGVIIIWTHEVIKRTQILIDIVRVSTLFCRRHGWSKS
ncbi:hypothetical protein Tdes44962_MAKER00759 [Teratosphaeria destructans]|uniref:Uncharacterized protein n=1 Tax=Teratosphaeria destructans TaxID=418781 RepID=A0A9W7SLX7_9PEZI|nr:hypothetical protein Tdes44962_MAKER00759 [Teratosphaeria destructans]